MTTYIDEHRDTFGVEPICQTLEIAPSTYYAARTRPPSKRSLEDARMKTEIERVHEDNFEVYGVRKVWRQLRREEFDIGRDHVGRLMDELDLCGVTRTKKVRTTKPAPESERPGDLVHRAFSADAPDRLWVADLTYVWTPRGFCYWEPRWPHPPFRPGRPVPRHQVHRAPGGRWRGRLGGIEGRQLR